MIVSWAQSSAWSASRTSRVARRTRRGNSATSAWAKRRHCEPHRPRSGLVPAHLLCRLGVSWSASNSPGADAQQRVQRAEAHDTCHDQHGRHEPDEVRTGAATPPVNARPARPIPSAILMIRSRDVSLVGSFIAMSFACRRANAGSYPRDEAALEMDTSGRVYPFAARLRQRVEDQVPANDVSSPVPMRGFAHHTGSRRSRTMEMTIDFPGGASRRPFRRLRGSTDQPPAGGGRGSAPTPFDTFMSTIGTCAGIYVLGFCRQRAIPTEGIRLVQRMQVDPVTHLVGGVTVTIELPRGSLRVRRRSRSRS